MKRPVTLMLWAMVGALAGAMTWGVGHARADDAVSSATQPYIAPVVPTYEKTPHDGGVIGVGERVREHGNSTRKDLLRKRTPKDIVSHGGGGTEGGGIGGTDTGTPLDGPIETQPISVDYRPAGNPPVAPEPSSLALMGIGLASWLLYNRRGKH